ncbi:MAG: MFS transporter, partial [Verrucomicrobia bacterium]|nr:MFS transporter [Verrucomicrobiota bacterium]
LNLDPAPLEAAHEFSLTPRPEDGPVTVTRELIIRPEDREEFLALVEQLRLTFLRNGAFLFRIDENLEHPGTFRTEMLVSSWAEHLRQVARMTKTEAELVERVRAMHAGEQEPAVRHYLPAKRLSTPLGFSRFQKQPDARFSQASRADTDSEQAQKRPEAAKVET